MDKEKLRRSSKELSLKVEKMYESFFEFLDLHDALENDDFIDLTYHSERVGLTPKMLFKMTEAVQKYREKFFERVTDIFQTRIEDFTIGTSAQVKKLDKGEKLD